MELNKIALEKVELDNPNPFKTPAGSIGATSSPTPSIGGRSRLSGYSSGIRSSLGPHEAKQRRFKSARLVGRYEKPWLEDSQYRRREMWDKIILFGLMTVGFLIGCLLCYLAYINVPRDVPYCLIMEDNFHDLHNWVYDIQLGDNSTNSFEWTTDDPRNSWIASDGLHIIPTLTLTTTNITGAELLDQYTLNLTAAGVCTETGDLYCAITSNLTSGAIINPVRSARLTTKGLKAIIYGRVEVVAKLPAGDWMWPAIRLMPVDSAYGIWPRSGEIDIIQSRGNDPKTYPGGRDWVSSALHWGIDLDRDAVQQTTGLHWLRRSDYSLDFHTFGMEWSENYLYTYIDNRLAQVLNVKFAKKDMWSRLPPVDGGGSDDNPWSQTGRLNTPFDQGFYLDLGVAVGGNVTTGGYFQDYFGKKPWIDGTPLAAHDFWAANTTWYPTWNPQGMIVKSVKMWQEGKCP